MRLTLRTLLSWKDGMLSEEAARELAEKVQASDAARRLVERIDEVASRPTLSASAPDATGLAAANSTAEYLDNVLPADELAAFERVCFASDTQLAETAACHEILAGWSREPAGTLDKASRRRLLAAVQAHASGGRRPGDESVTVGPLLRPATPDARSTARPAATAWLLVAAAVVLLAGLVGVLGWSLMKGRGKTAAAPAVAARAAAKPAATAGEIPPADEPPAPVDETVAAPPAAPADAIAPIAEPAPPVAAPAPAPPVAPPALAVPDDDFPPMANEASEAIPQAPLQAEAATPPAVAPPPAVAANDQRVPQGDALAIVAPAVPAVAPQAAVVAPPAAPAARADAGATVAGPAALLHRPAGDAAGAWQAGPAGTALALPVDLLAPPFGRPMVVVEGTRIALEPGSRAVLARDADGTPRLEVVFGAAAAALGGRVGVTAGGIAGVVTTGPAAPVGVEVRLVRRPGAPPDTTERIARIIPSAGTIGWRPTVADGSAPAVPGVGDAAADVPVGQALTWRSGAPDGVGAEASGPIPPWLAGRRTDDPIDRRAAEAVTLRLATAGPAVPALRELAADRRVEQRVAAAATLALVGEFDDLATLLAAEGRDGLSDGLWARLEAVAVEPALARGPRAAEGLARAFAAHAPPGAADAVVTFARGFTDDELAAGGAAHLVEALESPHLVVRRYAIKNLVEITGVDGVDRLRYRADRQPGTLRDGAAWWRARFEQGGIRRAAAGGAPP